MGELVINLYQLFRITTYSGQMLWKLLNNIKKILDYSNFD